MQLAEVIGRFIDIFYIKPFRKIFSREVFRYAACGGSNMVLDLVWYFVIYHFIIAERFIDLGVCVAPRRLARYCLSYHLFYGFLAQSQCGVSGYSVWSRPSVVALCTLGFGLACFELCLPEILCRGVQRVAHAS